MKRGIFMALGLALAAPMAFAAETHDSAFVVKKSGVVEAVAVKKTTDKISFNDSEFSTSLPTR